MLGESDDDNDELIEGWEMHVDLIEIKWRKFLAFETELNLMNQVTVETLKEDTSADEGDPEVLKEPSPSDAVANSPVTTSGKVEAAPTKVAINSDAEVGTSAVVLKVERIGEKPVRVLTALQGCSNQPGAAGTIE